MIYWFTGQPGAGKTVLAELLKVKFGSSMYTEDQENVMVSIPGLRGRDPKEIALKNLSEIIKARMEEIIDLVYHEIKVSGYENKLMTGIVLTGGGSQIKNLSQLVSFITGKESRIGYPNEHLGNDSKDKVTSPMYSTGVGLVLKGFEKIKNIDENIENDSEVTVSDDSKSESSTESGSFIDRMKRFFEEDIN